MMNQKILTLIVAIFTIITINAQNSYVTVTPTNDFQSALELYKLEKFAAAQAKFNLLKDFKDKSNAPFLNISTQAYYYDAICAYHLKNDDAKKKLQDFIKKNANHALTTYAHFYLGKYFFDHKKHKKTLAELNQVSKHILTENETTEFHFMLGYTNFFKKEFAASKEHFVKIYKLESAYYYQSNYYLGYMAYFDKQYEYALKHFLAVKQSKMYRNVVPYYIAQIYFIQKNYKQVIEYAEEIIEDPNYKYYKETLNILGQSYYQTRKFKQSIPYLVEYIDISDEVLTSDIYNLAYAYYHEEHFPEAIVEFSKLAENADSLGQNANYLLGDCFLKIDDKQGAHAAYYKASKLDFDVQIKETSSFNHAKLTYELAYHHDAIINIQSFLINYPYSRYQIEAKELLADILLNTKNYELAMEVIDGIENPTLKVKTAYQKVCFFRAVELFNDDYIEASLALFNKSLENPYDGNITAKAHYWKAEALYNLEKYDEATADYIIYTEAAPIAAELSLIENKPFAYYSLAYSFYNQKKYSEARTYFSSSIAAFNQLPDTLKYSVAFKKTYPDAMLRLADCYYLMRSFDRALKHYKSVFEKSSRGADYALYQSSVIYGLEGKKDPFKKIELLGILIKNYSWSNYSDDALFELGDTYFANENADSAIHYFKRVQDQHPGSLLGRKALLKLALIYFNNNELDLSNDQCSILLTQYPETAEGKEAINIIKKIFVAKGEVEDLVILLKESFPHVKFSLDEQDSLSYYAAELQYQNDHFSNAEELFNKYIEQFPNGYFIVNANYYSAECAFRDKRYNAALKGYEYIIEAKKNKYTETALLNASFIYHKIKQDYRKAYKHYENLLTQAELKNNKLTAIRGLALTAVELNKVDKVKLYASTLIAIPYASPDDITMSELFLGNVLIREQYLDSASTYLNKVKSKTTNEYGVEARYQIANIQYLKAAYDTSITLCFDIIQNLPNYPDWLAKSFILLGNNYHKLGNDYQAKATLQSIIDAYQGDETIVQEAKNKLADIIEEEERVNAKIVDSVQLFKDSILIEENDSILMEYDTLVLGGDTLLIEKDQELLEVPSLKDSINTDSINTIDTSRSIDIVIQKIEPQTDSLQIDSNKVIIEEQFDIIIKEDTIGNDMMQNDALPIIDTINTENIKTETKMEEVIKSDSIKIQSIDTVPNTIIDKTIKDSLRNE